MKGRASILIILVVLFGLLWLGFEWTVNRVYVPVGQSLVLTYKGPLIFGNPGKAPPGQFAQVDAQGIPTEIGMLEGMKGPGRHFYCPIWWERELVDDFVVNPGQVALVTRKRGKLLEHGNKVQGDYLVDETIEDAASDKHRGVLRKVYGPGRYRINPHAYDFKVLAAVDMAGSKDQRFGWVEVPVGYVGVVTNQTEIPRTGEAKGIRDKVLQPGIYMVNPQERKVDVVEIGYREKTLEVKKLYDRAGNILLDESGEPQIAADASGGISFPSKDGFPIHMDFTAIWGIMPDQAADAIRTFGNVDAVETKIVVPQVESICRNKGSEVGAVELLVGESRQKFQEGTREAFHNALEENNVTLLYGLVRDIRIPREVRIPIQNANVADELKLTRDQEQLTARTEADLREAEQKVKLESARITVETDKKVAKVRAEGDKDAAETRAETTKLVAAIDKQTAEIEAQATVMLGEADAKAQQMLAEAKAQKFALAVKAFGSGNAYNQWVFATGLPDDVKLQLLYAGEGTFWTDLKGFTETLIGKQVRDQQTKGK